MFRGAVAPPYREQRMPNYRRWCAEGGIYFFTLVTHERIPILTGPLARQLLRRAMVRVRQRRPFEQIGAALLPDHMHLLWRLPEGDANYSMRIGAIKQAFTRSWLAAGGHEGTVSPTRQRQEYRGVWQKRFYEHSIRNYSDFRRHLDYIHVNAARHGLTARPADWPWSSFHRFVKLGMYEPDWTGPVDVPGGLDVAPEEWWPEQ